MKFDIRVKLFGSFIIILIFGVAIILTLLKCITKISQDIDRITVNNLAIEQEVKDIGTQVIIARESIHSYLLDPKDTSQLDKKNIATQKILTELGEIKRLNLSTEMLTAVQDIEDIENKTLIPLSDKINEVVKQSDIEKAQQLYQTQYLAESKRQEDLAGNINSISLSQRANLFQDIIYNRDLSKWIASGAIIIFILVCLLVGNFLNRTITIPIIRLSSLLTRAAKGDLIDNYRYDTRRDEIGELSRSLNSFYEYIREMGVTASKIAAGNLTVQIKPRSTVDSFGTAFNTMVETLQISIADLRKTSEQLAQASNQMASASDQSSKMNEVASTSIEETSAAMHQMSANIQNVVNSTQTQLEFVTETSHRIEQMITSIEQVAVMAKRMFAIAEKSSTEVSLGVDAMANNSEGINQINDSINRTAETIKALERRTEDIGKIADVIAYLADQTNLLSLNAAIEAARAGEHGLGFAVVADEVRRLAERSAKSTREIEEIIKGIQREAVKATEDMGKSTHVAAQLLVQGLSVTTALKRIQQTVTEVCQYSQNIVDATEQQNTASEQIAQSTVKLRELMQEINAAGQEQAVGAKQVARAVEMLRELIIENTANSQNLANNGQQLSKQSELLQNVISRFTVGNNEYSKEK